MGVSADLAAFALELADTARGETWHRWAEDCAVEDKGGRVYDPVTEADRQAEKVMRQLIRERFPDHGVTGEEMPDEPGTSPFSWSLDPVDGTRSFICGLPTWTTLIALLEDGKPVLGLIDAPCLDETYVGFDGKALLYRKGTCTTMRTSGCQRLGDARVATTDPGLFSSRAAEGFDRLLRQARMVRYGHDGYAYARLAAGGLDLIVESGLKPHDYQPLIALVSSAGGTIADWRGGQDFPGGNIIAASTRELFEEALGYFEGFE